MIQSRSGSLSVVLVLLALVLSPSGARAWRTDVPEGDDEVTATHAEFDRAGNLSVVGAVDRTVSSKFFVVSFDPLGQVRWEASIVGPTHHAENVGLDGALDSHGNVIAVGRTDGCEECDQPEQFTVVKLARDTGSVLWQNDLGPHSGYTVAVDRHDDVVVGAGDFTAKFSGADGRNVWRQDEAGAPAATFGVHGEVYLVDVAPPTLARRAARDGHLRWRIDAPGVRAVAGTIGPDLVTMEDGVAGTADVVRRRGKNGREVWRTPTGNQSVRVCMDRGGVFVEALWPQVPSPRFLARLDVETGVELWRVPNAIGTPNDLVGLSDDAVVVYVPADAFGQMRAFARSDGRVLWTHPTLARVFRGKLATSRAGVVAVAGEDLYAALGTPFVAETFQPTAGLLRLP